MDAAMSRLLQGKAMGWNKIHTCISQCEEKSHHEAKLLKAFQKYGCNWTYLSKLHSETQHQLGMLTLEKIIVEKFENDKILTITLEDVEAGRASQEEYRAQIGSILKDIIPTVRKMWANASPAVRQRLAGVCRADEIYRQDEPDLHTHDNLLTYLAMSEDKYVKDLVAVARSLENSE